MGFINEKRKVLWIEDDENWFQSMKEVWYEYGALDTWEIETARKYSEAMKKLKGADPYNLLLINMNLHGKVGPDHSGIKLLKYIQENRPLPCILITGYPANSRFVEWSRQYNILRGIFIKGEIDLEHFFNIINEIEPEPEPKPGPELESNRTFFRVQFLQHTSQKMQIRGLQVPRGGQPKAIVELPYLPHELTAIFRALDLGEGERVADILKTEHVETLDSLKLLIEGYLHPEFHKMVGRKLYDTLSAQELLPEFEIAKGRPGAIAYQLCFNPEDFDLARFPWELIHDGSVHLVPGRRGIELTRYITFKDPPPQVDVTLPLKILFISPRPTGDTELPDDMEKKSLLNGLKQLNAKEQIAWEELTPPTWDALEARFNTDESFHIIHFDGHGLFSRICPRCNTPYYPYVKECKPCKCGLDEVPLKSYLHFENNERQLDRVSIDDMKAVLKGSQTQLIIITACGSGIVGDPSVFNGLASGLIQIGIPIVVGMQGSPPVATMIKFVKRFYESIARGQCIPEAVNRGRLAIFREKPTSWFMPVVYLRSSDDMYGQLFNIV